MTDYFFCNCTITTWQFMNFVTTYFRWGSCFLDYLTLCLVLMTYKVLERMYMLQVVVFCWCCVCVLSMTFVTDTSGMCRSRGCLALLRLHFVCPVIALLMSVNRTRCLPSLCTCCMLYFLCSPKLLWVQGQVLINFMFIIRISISYMYIWIINYV